MEACDPASAHWTARLGAASEPGRDGSPLRLSALRARRRGPARLLLLPHDLEPPRGERLYAAVDAAGLSPAHVQAPAPHIAVSEALSGRETLLCTAHEAHARGLSWAPLTDPPLLRGYRLLERPLPSRLTRDRLRKEAWGLLGSALGVGPAAENVA